VQFLADVTTIDRVSGGSFGTFLPFSCSASSAFDATAPSPTVFQDYLGAFSNGITLGIDEAPLELAYDPEAGLAASITYGVPEPSSFAIAALGGIAIVVSPSRASRLP
jgi:hypothetical protein